MTTLTWTSIPPPVSKIVLNKTANCHMPCISASCQCSTLFDLSWWQNAKEIPRPLFEGTSEVKCGCKTKTVIKDATEVYLESLQHEAAKRAGGGGWGWGWGGGGCRRKGTEERLQQEIGIDCGSVHLHTNSGVKGEACTEECPTE